VEREFVGMVESDGELDDLDRCLMNLHGGIMLSASLTPSPPDMDRRHDRGSRKE
jgi:hypothetical protein